MGTGMARLLQDLRFGLKSLGKTKRLTFAALACTALGIASAVFMFTLIQAILLRKPPFPGADRLVRVRLMTTDGKGQGDVSYLDFQDIQKQAKSFEKLEMVARTRMPVMNEKGSERIRGEAVSPGYFSLLGLKAAKGRLFTQSEYLPNENRVIVIGDDLWKRRFGKDPNILGKALRVRGRAADVTDDLYTIIGVMPPGFAGTVDYDISEFWLPLEHSPLRQMFESREARNVWTIGRLRPGVPLASAQAEIQEIGRRLAGAYPASYEGRHLQLEPFGESWRVGVRTGLRMLTVAAGLLLLIACTNIANLLLARLVQREHELTLRFVLGAQRRWVLRQLLVESVLLSVLGGAAGIVLAFWGINLFAATKSILLPSYVVLTPDLSVILVAVGLVLLTGVIFGVLPAWFGARLNANLHLRDAGRGNSIGRRQRFLGQALVVVEVTFTFVLVIGAMLMLRTYLNLMHADIGYRTDHVLRMAVTLDARDFPDPESYANFADRARETLRQYPGVRNVTFMSEVLPPHDDNAFDMALNGLPNDSLLQVPRHAIDREFLNVFGIPLQWGRAFEPTDRLGSPRVALVSEALARFIAGGDPRGALGKSFQLVANRSTMELSRPYEIVGVTKDISYRGPRPIHADRLTHYEIYVPLAQFPGQILSTAVITEADPATMSLPLQRELSRLAPTSPLHWISTMDEELANQYMDTRFYAYLTTGYSVCALLLAALGIYGVLANSVSRRQGELGIRMAIGAQGSDIVRLVVGQGMRTLLLGLVLGAAIAVLGTKLVASILYGLTPSDPLTFTAVAAVVLLIGLVACYLPARRATQVDPGSVLRNG
jgi:putative ABC transport system permease protein